MMSAPKAGRSFSGIMNDVSASVSLLPTSSGPASTPDATGAIYDISVPISSHLVCWPGDPPVEVTRVIDIANGDPATVSSLKMGSHTGTHVDAFAHFKKDGLPLNAMSLDTYIGPALVVEIEDPRSITLGELQRNPAFLDLRKAKRVLFKTVNSSKDWSELPFQEEFCHLSPHAANFLIELGVQLIGIDYLSVEGYKAAEEHDEEAPTHHRLMDAGVYIVEGLALGAIRAGWYEMICLPLSIHNGDGAPARVVLRDVYKTMQSAKSSVSETVEG